VAGYLIARESGVRPLGGGVLAAAGGWCTREWTRRSGAPRAGALLGVYAAAFAGSHALARRIGAWPAVFASAAASGAAAWVFSDRAASRRPDGA
jgi:thiol:disulfide interchange protein